MRCTPRARPSKRGSFRAAASRSSARCRRWTASSSATTGSTASTSSAARSRSRCARSPRNAGVDGSIVVDKVKNGKGAFGFNAATEEYEDLVKAGVIDPTKVVRAALQNAASVASLMLTTEALIAERPKKKSGGSQGEPDTGGMGGGNF